MQAGDKVTFSLLKRPRRGIIPCEVAGAIFEDKQLTAGEEKVRSFQLILECMYFPWCKPKLQMHGKFCLKSADVMSLPCNAGGAGGSNDSHGSLGGQIATWT